MTAKTYRVELERLDRGYEARVPTIHGCSCIGLTENETLRRLEIVLGEYQASAAVLTPIRLEVFRT